MRASVIIPVHNGEATIGACLEALLNQTVPKEDYEVIVVDDGSTDATAQVVKGYGVRLLTQPHRGPAAARNLGAAHARGQILLFTDADCQPTPNWIEEMTRPFADPEVVGAKGTYLTRQRALVARFVQIEYEDRYDRMAKRENIDFIDTYSAAYRRDVFLANGGFDTTFPTASVEDQEFSFRLARKGYRLVFVPAARVYHHHDATLGEYVRRKFYIGFWKALLTRWHPERLISDAHTPQVLKVQMILMALALAGLPLAILWPRALGFSGGMGFLFLLTTLPFTLKAARKDLTVALASPFLLAVRALALGAGFAWGKLRFLGRKEGRKAVLNARQRAIKRAIDIIGSVVGLILAAPLMAVIAILIKLDSKGPVFYVQERVGEGGKVFKMYKFRSMVDGADKMLDQLVKLEELPSPAFKLKNDPRVTRVGRILRRTSLDELPQLFNVLKGEMSLVGPRPEEVRVVKLYNDWHRQRLAVKPGLTGPMQVSGRGDLPLDERVRLELDYIEHYSLWKDIKILLKTIPAVISGKGAY